MDKPKYSLHLFAGCGGGIQADLIHGITPVCAVEINPYCQQVLAKRFPAMPVWDDVSTFSVETRECSKVFEQLRERSDDLVIAGGFPCQDISIAGNQAGISGERSGLWTEFSRIICEVGPRFVFVENSDQLVRLGMGRVLGDLARLGYDAAWGVLGASEVGARHVRKRMWITAKRHN